MLSVSKEPTVFGDRRAPLVATVGVGVGEVAPVERPVVQRISPCDAGFRDGSPSDRAGPAQLACLEPPSRRVIRAACGAGSVHGLLASRRVAGGGCVANRSQSRARWVRLA